MSSHEFSALIEHPRLARRRCVLDDIKFEVLELILADLETKCVSRLYRHIVEEQAKLEEVVIVGLSAVLPRRQILADFSLINFPSLLIDLCECVCWVAKADIDSSQVVVCLEKNEQVTIHVS